MNEPLVSVYTVTYNSAEFVLETLESVKAQTYKNLELIVTDDCSKDNTVEICKKWISENKDRFVNAKVLTAPINTGVAANSNRGIAAASGEWIKGIAGDDLLAPNCVADYVAEAELHPEECVFLGLCNRFTDTKEGRKYTNMLSPEIESMLWFSSLQAHEQFRALLTDKGRIVASSAFIRRDVLIKYPYNDKYKFMEDFPLWVLLTHKGIHIYTTKVLSSSYRLHDSLSNNVTSYFSSRYFETKNLYFWNEKRQYFIDENLPEGYNNNRKMLLTNALIDGLTQNHVSFINSFKVRLINYFVNHFVHFKM